MAHTADKISAVKHKGKSPQFSEQKRYSAPKPVPDSAPSGLSRPPKQKQRGGKRKKEHRAHIVSSAFVPSAVLNRMQESHYTEAGPSTSRVEEVVEPPAPTPVPVTVIGGPSRAPVRSAAPVSIATIRPSNITYSKAVTLPMQSMSGSSSTKAPFNMEKERMLLKQAGVRPTVEPLRAMHKIVEEKDDAMDKAQG